jgi:hypothetical protein
MAIVKLQHRRNGLLRERRLGFGATEGKENFHKPEQGVTLLNSSFSQTVLT